MKIIVTKILSLQSDGACCYLLNIGDQIKILLDCGITRDFNFQHYQKYKAEIQSVDLILISHSFVQYSGALPFLISEFDINPKNVYTTQPIMRYAPLNFHQEMLGMRVKGYDKKVFNKVYSYFEQIQIIKPYQKKIISVELKKSGESLLKGTSKTVHFSSYQAGGTLSSLCWKIRSGLVNILYMVDLNNFSLNHINGLDFQAIKHQPINLLLTDMYPDIPDEKIKKDKLYIEIKRILIQFYQQQAIDPVRPRPFTIQNEKKLLITCYPNQMLIEIMITLGKVITDLQELAFREKVTVIHLSSRYLQLIKSQVEHFSDEAKPIVDKIDNYFIHAKSLLGRINVSSVNQINGILNAGMNEQFVQVVHFGQIDDQQKYQRLHSKGYQNIQKFKLLGNPESNQLVDQQIPLKMDNFQKLQQDKIQQQSLAQQIQIKQQQQQKDQPDNLNLKIQRSYSSMIKHEKQNQSPLNEVNLISQKPKNLVSKYLSQISFPHFVSTYHQEEFDFNDYGLKHHLQPSNRPAKKTINDLNQNDQLPQLSLIAKKSTVQVMNIQFSMSDQFRYFDVSRKGKIIENYAGRTNFDSSFKILQILNPKHVFILNSQTNQQSLKLYDKYSRVFKNQLYNLATSPKNQSIIKIQNELVQYKVNYLPLGHHPLQKVKGKVECINGVIHLHIQILEEKQILEFRLEKFYQECKMHFGKGLCKFTGKGIFIAGITICREENQIIFSGEYSEAFFKVRAKLYQFLRIR